MVTWITFILNSVSVWIGILSKAYLFFASVANMIYSARREIQLKLNQPKYTCKNLEYWISDIVFWKLTNFSFRLIINIYYRILIFLNLWYPFYLTYVYIITLVLIKMIRLHPITYDGNDFSYHIFCMTYFDMVTYSQKYIQFI